ncbi:hypothetical protein C8P68_102257 [Mucilaginibacter yixingensis]|uniref:Lysylphosphatidylglycerol synthase-like protein n=1 Tax=Mucilaginibacter yixingensis TaxID=1295612 RepID=A0A2T5JCE7_9SPHI|nr:lysylphosphatidylglycerol synthase transmembrane domain-containing protein [Mucilaginibacter yixingensis]PTQ99433.1 hypothetical protein C8P68_102257 [Mucilaginibacter yixingensis]
MATLKQEAQEPKTPKQKLWNVTQTVLKFAITGSLLYWVFTKVPISQAKDRLLHANYWWMLAALLCYFCSIIASSWRLLSFFKSIDLRLAPRFNFRLYMLGLFYNMLLPGGIGGDGYKIWLLNKSYGLSGKKVFWALLFDRLSGLWAIGLIIISLKIFIPQIEIHFAIPFAVFAFGTMIYYVIVKRFFADFGKHFFKGHAKAILVQTCQVMAIIMVLMGQGFNGKFAPYLLSFLVSAFASVVPTVGGLGAREAIFQWCANLFGMNVGLAVFLSVSFYLISLTVALFGVYYVLRPKRLEDGLPPKETPAIDEHPTEHLSLPE